jgi:lipopolysaccharide export system permease protein
MLLFHSSIRKEMARNFGATVVVMTTIVITVLLVRTLGLATDGTIDPSDAIIAMAYTVLGNAPTILALSLFIAIVSTLSRMQRDQELVIWYSSGQGLGDLVLPLFRFAWPVLLTITALLIFAWPWAHSQSQSLRDRFESRGDLERVAPGQFQSSADGSDVFFVDKSSAGAKIASDVFIAQTNQRRQTLTHSRSGAVQTYGPDRFLVLSLGQSFENELDNSGFKMRDFEQYIALIGSSADGLIGKYQDFIEKHRLPELLARKKAWSAGQTETFDLLRGLIAYSDDVSNAFIHRITAMDSEWKNNAFMHGFPAMPHLL